MRRFCKKRFLFVVLFIAFLILLHVSSFTSHFTLEKMQKYAMMLSLFIHENYWLSVLLFCSIFIGATIFFLPVTILLTILAGYLFGVVPGLLYATVSATVGSSMVFLAVRYLLGGIVEKHFMHRVSSFKKAVATRGYSYLLMLQLLPITPTPLINIIAGLTPISLLTFVWTTFVGMLPGSLIYVIAGQQLAHIQKVSDIISWPMIAVLSALAFLSLLIPYALSYMRRV